MWIGQWRCPAVLGVRIGGNASFNIERYIERNVARIQMD